MNERNSRATSIGSQPLLRARGVLQWWRAARCANRKGQTAVIFVVLIALALVLAAFTMNLGEVARLKTSTANAADAGALAGASWVASLMNEYGTISAVMWALHTALSIMFAWPFCFYAIWVIFLIYALYLAEQAISVLIMNTLRDAVWKTAHKAAFFTTVQNLNIDDPTGAVEAEIQAMGGNVPALPKTFTWNRTGGDLDAAVKVARPSSVTIDTRFSGSAPSIQIVGVPPVIAWAWLFPFCVYAYCCLVIGSAYITPGSPFLTGGPIPVLQPLMGICVYCYFPIFFFLPGMVPIGINNDRDRVTVTVTQKRSGGANMGFWTMKYPPAGIVSQAVAEYTGTNVMGLIPSLNHDADSGLKNVPGVTK